MLQGVDKDIVVLTVRDAVAVQQKHEDWAVDTMLEAWDRVAASSAAVARCHGGCPIQSNRGCID
jgi:hypothetical protein